jgi:hypothetical protein
MGQYRVKSEDDSGRLASEWSPWSTARVSGWLEMALEEFSHLSLNQGMTVTIGNPGVRSPRYVQWRLAPSIE